MSDTGHYCKTTGSFYLNDQWRFTRMLIPWIRLKPLLEQLEIKGTSRMVHTEGLGAELFSSPPQGANQHHFAWTSIKYRFISFYSVISSKTELLQVISVNSIFG